MRQHLLAIAIGISSLSPLASAQDCASAVTLSSNSTYVSDTTGTTDWMFQFGPLSSVGSNDMLYTFVAGQQPRGVITPFAASYSFAMYLIASCSDTGSEPTPILATATVGLPIDLSSSLVITGARYYLAVTGTAANPGNGTVSFMADVPVELQSFTVD